MTLEAIAAMNVKHDRPKRIHPKGARDSSGSPLERLLWPRGKATGDERISSSDIGHMTMLAKKT
ncbi:hypothetical protein Pla52n_17720 [Stieleria varia]|uniref:Uncharacterized protein n=1 Tax=Stieleria varia TaxID=2528005 RepID=A0A5C6B1P6_9BACT|nr:hypothetical protein Pla52n_17720 [Stieleria varia]